MNLNLSEVQDNLRNTVSAEVSLLGEGVDRYRVFTPFEFEDGDHFSIVLKKDNGSFVFTDEAHTIMHMSYDMDVSALKKGTRQKILTNTIANFGLEENNGELFIRVKEDNFGASFYNFVQALVKITDLSYLSKEQVRSTFYEDFQALISESVPKERITFNYAHPEFDREKKYVVDCCINGMPKPLYFFAILNDSKCKDVMISMYQFERWNIKYNSVSIFENQETINRRVLAQFSDIGEKQFSSLLSNKDRITKYLFEQIENVR
ncbi:DUF1828 domain-containing protein [candidate division KSB1 bacterium]|nr:DUF1828 domain-containing protein [candidate division KSB1 bacterium]